MNNFPYTHLIVIPIGVSKSYSGYSMSRLHILTSSHISRVYATNLLIIIKKWANLSTYKLLCYVPIRGWKFLKTHMFLVIYHWFLVLFISKIISRLLISYWNLYRHDKLMKSYPKSIELGILAYFSCFILSLHRRTVHSQYGQ